MAVRTLDLVARHKSEYAAARSPRLVTAGPGRYLALAGAGEAGGEAFRRQAAAVLAMGRAVRASTRARGKDFRLPPLEVLRWREAPPRRAPGEGAGDPGPAPEPPPDNAAREWWKVLLRVPNFVKGPDLAAAAGALSGGPLEDEVCAVRVEALKEGRCVQAVHVGPPSTEAETVERMRRAAADLGLAFHGKRHEILLTRSGRASPERSRTILRQPVRTVR
ncbi:MAG TPA: hypothetical protein VFR85_07400 [Anaeromyxobacteraceae bacterium]|nr:hypothetical protein [Anaeromyxobacteraceae bacterium]